MAKRKEKNINACDAATLRRVREAAGLSGLELARRIGMNKNWTSKVESGVVALAKEKALDICRALSIPASSFGLDEASPVMEFSGAKLAKLAKRRRIPLRQLAKLVGVSSATVYRWVHDGAQPAEASVELLAETLEVSRDALYAEKRDREARIPRSQNVEEKPIASNLGPVYLVVVPKVVWERSKKALEQLAGYPLHHCDASSLFGSL